jgi:hypothetical protein
MNSNNRIYRMILAGVYPYYIQKVGKKDAQKSKSMKLYAGLRDIILKLCNSKLTVKPILKLFSPKHHK